MGVTRGHGVLEGFLARKRAAMAERLMPADRSGTLLDVGCGTFPFFLTQVKFERRVGLDRHVADEAPKHPQYDATVELHNFDIDREDRLPFAAEVFDVVTMLAVFEHIRPERMPILLSEIERVLKPGGRVILTTPSSWTEPILNTMAKVGLVSSEEIDEHQPHYSPATIRAAFANSSFGKRPVKTGTFELGMNTWAVVNK